MKLNHKQVLVWIALNVRVGLPLIPDIDGNGKIVLSTDTCGKNETLTLTVHVMSFYKDYRYMWE